MRCSLMRRSACVSHGFSSGFASFGGFTIASLASIDTAGERVYILYVRPMSGRPFVERVQVWKAMFSIPGDTLLAWAVMNISR